MPLDTGAGRGPGFHNRNPQVSGWGADAGLIYRWRQRPLSSALGASTLDAELVFAFLATRSSGAGHVSDRDVAKAIARVPQPQMSKAIISCQDSSPRLKIDRQVRAALDLPTTPYITVEADYEGLRGHWCFASDVAIDVMWAFVCPAGRDHHAPREVYVRLDPVADLRK